MHTSDLFYFCETGSNSPGPVINLTGPAAKKSGPVHVFANFSTTCDTSSHLGLALDRDLDVVVYKAVISDCH